MPKNVEDELSPAGLTIIQEYISSLKTTQDLSEKTLRNYLSDLRLFALWFELNNFREDDITFRLEDVATPTITEYRRTLQNDHKLKPTTINRRLISIKGLFEWAITSGQIQRNPAKAVKLVPAIKVSPRQMNNKEEAALIAAVENSGSSRDLAIVTIMFQAGLREMEVCNLEPGDVSIQKRSGSLIVRSGKFGKQREVPLNITCRTALEEYMMNLDPNSEYLFPSKKTGSRLTERGIRHMVGKYCKLSGLTEWSAHDLRHRFGYVMAKKTPLHRLAQIMGHDRLDTTKIYVQANPEDLQEEVEKISWE